MKALQRPGLVIVAPKRKPHEVASHRVPVYDHKQRLVGHVGKFASASVAARIAGNRDVELHKKGKVDNRVEWHANPPPKPPPPKIAAQPKPQPNIVIQGTSEKPKIGATAKPKAGAK